METCSFNTEFNVLANTLCGNTNMSLEWLLKTWEKIEVEMS